MMLTIARGQPVEILTSSLTSSDVHKSHPVAGDKGFISNAYLYPLRRLILCDIYFFQFSGHEVKTRCERKLFVINLRGDNLCQNPLQALLDFHNSVKVNLTDAFSYIDGDSVFRAVPEMASPNGIFRNSSRRSEVSSITKMIIDKQPSQQTDKIPFGTVRLPTFPKEITDHNTILALFKSVRPVLNSLLQKTVFIQALRKKEPLIDLINDILQSNFHRENTTLADKRASSIYNPICGVPDDVLLECTRKLQALAGLVSRKATSTIVHSTMGLYREHKKTYGKDRLIETILDYGLCGLFNASDRDSINNLAMNRLGPILCKVLLSSTTTEEISNVLASIQDFLPRDLSLETFAQKITSIKTKGISDSAALNRFFDTGFFR